jgi:hypothetical protein
MPIALPAQRRRCVCLSSSRLFSYIDADQAGGRHERLTASWN